eukprot:1041557-Prorocentrum_minimum.AAC.4
MWLVATAAPEDGWWIQFFTILLTMRFPYSILNEYVHDHIGEVKENGGSPKDAANCRPNHPLGCILFGCILRQCRLHTRGRYAIYVVSL